MEDENGSASFGFARIGETLILSFSQICFQLCFIYLQRNRRNIYIFFSATHIQCVERDLQQTPMVKKTNKQKETTKKERALEDS